jgi:hypothetical protein
MMKKRAQPRRWYYIRYEPSKHAMQTMAMDLETLGLYTRLSDSAYNNDCEPGTICQQLSIIAAMGLTTVKKAWELLCKMVPHQSEGRCLVRLQCKNSKGTWDQITENCYLDAKNEKKSETLIVKITFFCVIESEVLKKTEDSKNAAKTAKHRYEKALRDVTVTGCNTEKQTVTRGNERHNSNSNSNSNSSSNSIGNGDVTTTETKKAFESWFETVYEKYPKKNKKYPAMEEARKVWAEVDVRRVEEALERSKREDHRFAELRFTPYLVNWLAERPWEQPADAEPDTERDGHATAMNCGMPPELLETDA